MSDYGKGRSDGAEGERAYILKWLETLPWKGTGTLHIGQIIEAIKRGDHYRVAQRQSVSGGEE